MPTRPGNVPDHVPYLVLLHGAGERKPRVLDRDVSTVGRARGCDMCLDASDVSTIHCVLFRAPRGYHVRDCNSRTGTRVNGDAVRGLRQLIDGDILQVGPFSFAVHVPRRLSSPDVALPDAAKLERLCASRQRLAGHALRLRRRLRERREGSIDPRSAELQHELARVAEMARVSERRLHDLAEADRELEADREKLRTHVQAVERQLAEQLTHTDQQVRERWQEFQRRCHAAEMSGGLDHSVADGEGALLARELQLAQDRETLQAEREAFERMTQQLANGRGQAHAADDQQRAVLAQQEAAMRSQRNELARMIEELRALQKELTRPVAAQLAELSEENERLRRIAAELKERAAHAGAAPANTGQLKETRAENELLRLLLQDRERELNEALERLTAAAPVEEAAPAELKALRGENARLQERLARQEAHVEELRAKAAPRPQKSAGELELFETELAQERQELERERSQLAAEMEQLRVRNEELDDATRELEMQMSRERADMARERMRMDRLREELKQDQEKMQRELSMRESLAPVNRLRDEMKKPAGASADPVRHLRHNDTPRS